MPVCRGIPVARQPGRWLTLKYKICILHLMIILQASCKKHHLTGHVESTEMYNVNGRIPRMKFLMWLILRLLRNGKCFLRLKYRIKILSSFKQNFVTKLIQNQSLPNKGIWYIYNAETNSERCTIFLFTHFRLKLLREISTLYQHKLTIKCGVFKNCAEHNLSASAPRAKTWCDRFFSKHWATTGNHAWNSVRCKRVLL